MVPFKIPSMGANELSDGENIIANLPAPRSRPCYSLTPPTIKNITLSNNLLLLCISPLNANEFDTINEDIAK